LGSARVNDNVFTKSNNVAFDVFMHSINSKFLTHIQPNFSATKDKRVILSIYNMNVGQLQAVPILLRVKPLRLDLHNYCACRNCSFANEKIPRYSIMSPADVLSVGIPEFLPLLKHQ
jgi:hypothetical protein